MGTENPAVGRGQSFGQAGVMHVLATADKPMTASEVAAISPVEPGSISTTLLRLYRKGLLVRRRRRKNEQVQAGPYEYALQAPENVPYINDA